MDIHYYKQYEPIFGVWKITRLIGEGSFGKVFELEREDFGVIYKAALKAITIPTSQSELRSVLADGLDEAGATEYFSSLVQELAQEFDLMSKLKGNSNVVSYEIHRVMKHKEGIGWDILIQMELLTPLNDYTRSQTITRKDVIKLGIDICKALELCQKFNIIHRDVKPENIFISESGDFKLGDFGIARTAEKTTSGLSKKGTYAYMAPEVYREQPYGSTVDIYSLGIVLYRLLNENRTPFMPAYPAPITHTDRENALAKRFSGVPLPLPVHGDGRLGEIVLKACAYDPAQRYSSPMQMRQELEAILYNQEEGRYIYPGGDTAPQKSLEYAATGDTPVGIQTDPSGKQPQNGGTVSIFGGGTGNQEADNKTESVFGKGRDSVVETEDKTESAFGPAGAGPVTAPPQKKAGKLPLVVGAAAVAVVGICVGLSLLGKGQPPATTPSDTSAVVSSQVVEPGAYAQAGEPTSVVEYEHGGRLERFLNENEKEIYRVYYNADGEVEVWFQAEYNEAGDMTRQTTFNEKNEEQTRVERVYNEKGTLLEQTTYWNGDQLLSRLENVLDQAGHVVQQNTYNSRNMMTGWYTYENDANGKTLKSIEYSRDGSVTGQREYERSADGTPLRSVYTDLSSGSRYEYEYNAAGHLEEQIYSGKDGFGYKVEHLYNGSGQRVKEIWTYNDGDSSHSEYLYAADGTELKEITSSQYGNGNSDSYEDTRINDIRGTSVKSYRYDSDGSWDEYEYFPFFNERKDIRYDADGTVASRTVYEYSQEGDLLSETTRAADGQETEWSKYNYDTAGVLQERVHRYYSQDRSYQEYFTDGDYNDLKNISYAADGTVTDWTEHSYDAAGNKTGSVTYNADGSVNHLYEYTYDAQGKQTAVYSKWMRSDGSCDEYFYDGDFNKLKDVSYAADGSIKNWIEYSYDSAGKQTGYIRYNADGSKSGWREYSYDAAGNQIKDVSYNADGSISSLYEYSLDSQGNRTAIYHRDTYSDGSYYETFSDGDHNTLKRIEYEADGTIKRWTEYSYNSDGQQSKVTYYNGDGAVENWTEYNYNSDGKQSKVTDYNGDGAVKNWTEYSYNAAGNRTKEVSYKADGSISSLSEYSFDSQGNRTAIYHRYVSSDGSYSETFSDGNYNTLKSIEYTAAGTFESRKEYSYNSDGKKSKVTHYNGDGAVERWTEYSYNSDGEQSKITHYNGDGTIGDWTEYTYNAAGKKVKEQFYDSDGVLDYWYEYVYDETGNYQMVRHKGDES